jgi:hypothetical protein
MLFVNTRKSLLASRSPSGNSQVSVKTGSKIDPAADASNMDALKQVLALGGIGLGAGAGVRALTGFRDMLARSMAAKRRVTRPAVIEIGVPQMPKMAEDVGYTPSLHIPTQAQEIKPDSAGWADWFAGRTNVNKWEKPWFLSAALGAPALGIYGGYKTMDSMINAAQKRDRVKELDNAKDEYRKALLEQYAANGIKGASEKSELAKDLDTLVDLVKQADYLSTAANMYLPLAAILAGGTGLATYNWTKSRSPEERLAKAIKQRERLRWAARPPEIYAVAKPVPPTKPKDVFTAASADEISDVQKYAGLQGLAFDDHSKQLIDQIEKQDMKKKPRAKSHMDFARDIASLYKP